MGDERRCVAPHAHVVTHACSEVLGVLRHLLVRWVALAVAVGLCAALLPGVHIDGGFGSLLVVALVWGLVNGVLGPIVRFLSLPFRLAFGVVALLINALLFMLADVVASRLHVDGFFWAILAVFVMAFLTVVIDAVLNRYERRDATSRAGS
jgi:putative membrane protein